MPKILPVANKKFDCIFRGVIYNDVKENDGFHGGNKLGSNSEATERKEWKRLRDMTGAMKT